MAMQGCRLLTVFATILIYIGGVLFLSMNNAPGMRSRSERAERFAELSSFHSSRYVGHSRKITIHWCKELHYLSSEGLPTYDIESSSLSTSNLQNPSSNQPGPTALASFPGSGNTWLRYLLQQSTGILTGSIYKDYGLLKTGFPAENVCNSSVLVVKTHEWGDRAWLPFSKAILLVRDPEKSILAEFNRQSGGHIGFASPDRYKRTKGKYWQQFVAHKLKGWELMNLSWARNYTGSLKVVFYDELVNETRATLIEILDFLDFHINEGLLNCAIVRKEGIFRRKKRLLSFDPFTSLMRAQIDDRRRYVYSILGRTL